MTRARRLLLALWMSASACVPLTYSEEGAVDFGEYRSVRVSVASPLDAVRASDYLARELSARSGFFHVTVNPAEDVDAVLDVSVSATLETTSNDDGTIEFHYSSEANYRLSTPTNPNVDSGTETDQSEFEEEAIEDALDQIVAHYIRPYRL